MKESRKNVGFRTGIGCLFVMLSCSIATSADAVKSDPILNDDPFAGLGLVPGNTYSCKELFTRMRSVHRLIDHSDISSLEKMLWKRKIFRHYERLQEGDAIHDFYAERKSEQVSADDNEREKDWRSTPSLPAELRQQLEAIDYLDFSDLGNLLEYMSVIYGNGLEENPRLLSFVARRLFDDGDQIPYLNAIAVIQELAPASIEFQRRLVRALTHPYYDVSAVGSALMSIHTLHPAAVRDLLDLATNDDVFAEPARTIVTNLSFPSSAPYDYSGVFHYLVRAFRTPAYSEWAWEILSQPDVPEAIWKLLINNLPTKEMENDREVRDRYLAFRREITMMLQMGSIRSK